MGWKVSMIIIQNPDNYQNEESLLQLLGKDKFRYVEDTTLEESIYPQDESINIGYYNNCIIICDDFQLSGKFIMEQNTPETEGLIKLFPDSEILTVSCYSLTNFHGYSLIKNGKTIRAKALSTDDGIYINSGNPIEEEQSIYAISQMRGNKHYWVFDTMPDDEFSEDQLMEDFTFGLAKRLLGVKLDGDEADELLFKIPFKKYSET